ncbi:hypothetical protein [Antarcticirhabdus aurantiaca]|uniref:Uncharacterized protein n=1 Tax=Antarcticirhabdus aurantiaca TaxID=2606717 RepID=A0ACD4NI40_9HYPH|nr:hypothetical protein [Antarcticirhabdus aurantiaca]WAJ26503.1 hypothetical protein OXU80_16660 [Jeongeuplla avenae]
MDFAQEMDKRLPAGMGMPGEFAALLQEIEARGWTMPSERHPGDRLGLLGSEAELQDGVVTTVLFRGAPESEARDFGRDWFGDVVPDIERRLVPFARTGGDGSYAAFWIDDAGEQRIVHLGSDGVTCLLGGTPLDFLRLLAIGYDEIGGDCLAGPHLPPDTPGRNAAYRDWLSARFGVSVPATAAEILGEVPDGLAEDSADPLWRWVRVRQDERDAAAR